jgi:hypothetical protein
MKELKLKDLDVESHLAINETDQDVNIVRLIFFKNGRINIKKKLVHNH